jgi:hypothetical protein
MVTSKLRKTIPLLPLAMYHALTLGNIINDVLATPPPAPPIACFSESLFPCVWLFSFNRCIQLNDLLGVNIRSIVRPAYQIILKDTPPPTLPVSLRLLDNALNAKGSTAYEFFS